MNLPHRVRGTATRSAVVEGLGSSFPITTGWAGGPPPRSGEVL